MVSTSPWKLTFVDYSFCSNVCTEIISHCVCDVPILWQSHDSIVDKPQISYTRHHISRFMYDINCLWARSVLYTKVRRSNSKIHTTAEISKIRCLPVNRVVDWGVRRIYVYNWIYRKGKMPSQDQRRRYLSVDAFDVWFYLGSFCWQRLTEMMAWIRNYNHRLPIHALISTVYWIRLISIWAWVSN